MTAEAFADEDGDWPGTDTGTRKVYYALATTCISWELAEIVVNAAEFYQYGLMTNLNPQESGVNIALNQVVVFMIL